MQTTMPGYLLCAASRWGKEQEGPVMSTTQSHASASGRPLALVTGASSGIGLELARQFADNGYDLVIAAEDDELEQVAPELERAGATVWAERVDLATRQGVEQLVAAIASRPVAAAALNAGVGVAGRFDQIDLEDDLRLVELNVVHSFAEAIRYELQGTGVTVTSLMPGPTDTEFFARAGMEDTKVGQSGSKDDPADVARQGFEALMAGKDHVVAGSAMNKAQTAAGKLLRDPMKARIHASMTEPGSGDS
jgi:short-subunit dehydrogenase